VEEAMPERQLTLTNDVGLHARPAAVFSKSASKHECDVVVVKDGKEANAKSVMSVLKLDVKKGDTITLRTDGNGAEQALSQLAELIEQM
jgi:phosphocarrier protein HPr